MEDAQHSGPEEQATATTARCQKQLPKRYVLALMCNLAFFFRGLVVANIGQMVFVKGIVAGSDLYPKVTNTTLIEMSNIVFSYHWVIILGQMPAAILVYKYSARKIMIASMILSSLLQIITPWTLSKSLAGIVLNVFFQSLCLCPLDYACIGLLGKWAPSTERNRLLMLSFTGRFAHYQLAYLLSFKLLTSISPTFSYYFAGIAGAIWCILWYAFIKDDSPPENESNSESEEKASCKLKDVPCKNIVMSLPLLSLCLVFACPTLLNLSLMDLILFQNIPNWEFLGYSSLIMNTVIFIPVAGFLIDKLMSKDKVKTSTIRKVIGAGGLAFHVLFVLLHTIENDITVPLCFYVAFLIMDLTVAGLIPNFLELSARYCVLLMGLAMTVTTVFSRLFDYVSEMTQQDTTTLESENVEYNFLMDQLPVWLTTILGALMFAVFGSTEEQSWSSKSQPDIELQDDIEKNSKKEILEEACNPQV